MIWQLLDPEGVLRESKFELEWQMCDEPNRAQMALFVSHVAEWGQMKQRDCNPGKVWPSTN